MVTIKITIIPPITALTTYGASRYFWPALPNWIWIPTTIFISVLCLLFIIARRTRELETPNVDIRLTNEPIITPEMQRGILDGPRPHNLLLVIKNTSHRAVNGLKVKLMKIILDDSGFQEPKKALNFLHHENDNEVSINSGDEERAFLGTHVCDKNGGIYKLWNMEHLNNQSIIFVIQVSSGSFPAFTKRFELKHDTKYNSLSLGET